MILVNDFLIFFFIWCNGYILIRPEKEDPKFNPNPHTFANNKIITFGGGGVRKLQIVPTRDICVFSSAILYLPVFVLIFFFSFIFFVLQVFTWVGLWKSHPTLCIPQILMSHIRSPSALTGNQSLSCIGYRKSKKSENSNGTLLVMCELGCPFLQIFRKSVQKLKRKKKLVRKIKTIQKGTCDKKKWSLLKYWWRRLKHLMERKI